MPGGDNEQNELTYRDKQGRLTTPLPGDILFFKTVSRTDEDPETKPFSWSELWNRIIQWAQGSATHVGILLGTFVDPDDGIERAIIVEALSGGITMGPIGNYYGDVFRYRGLGAEQVRRRLVAFGFSNAFDPETWNTMDEEGNPLYLHNQTKYSAFQAMLSQVRTGLVKGDESVFGGGDKSKFHNRGKARWGHKYGFAQGWYCSKFVAQDIQIALRDYHDLVVPNILKTTVATFLSDPTLFAESLEQYESNRKKANYWELPLASGLSYLREVLAYSIRPFMIDSRRCRYAENIEFFRKYTKKGKAEIKKWSAEIAREFLIRLAYEFGFISTEDDFHALLKEQGIAALKLPVTDEVVLGRLKKHLASTKYAFQANLPRSAAIELAYDKGFLKKESDDPNDPALKLHLYLRRLAESEEHLFEQEGPLRKAEEELEKFLQLCEAAKKDKDVKANLDTMLDGRSIEEETQRLKGKVEIEEKAFEVHWLRHEALKDEAMEEALEAAIKRANDVFRENYSELAPELRKKYKINQPTLDAPHLIMDESHYQQNRANFAKNAAAGLEEIHELHQYFPFNTRYVGVQELRDKLAKDKQGFIYLGGWQSRDPKDPYIVDGFDWLRDSSWSGPQYVRRKNEAGEWERVLIEDPPFKKMTKAEEAQSQEHSCKDLKAAILKLAPVVKVQRPQV